MTTKRKRCEVSGCTRNAAGGDTKCTIHGGRKRPPKAFCDLGVLLGLILVAWSLLAPLAARAQDVQLPEPTLLREGRPAPFTGQLMHQEDLLLWSRTIEDLRNQLAHAIELEQERCDVRTGVERAQTRAAEDRAAVRETLYRARLDELATTVREARSEAVTQWYEHPAMWFTAGVLATVAVVLVASQL